VASDSCSLPFLLAFGEIFDQFRRRGKKAFSKPFWMAR